MEVPNVTVDEEGLQDHREDPSVRDHELYMEQQNWTVADVTNVDNGFVCDMGPQDVSYPFKEYDESIRVDLDGVSTKCDAFEHGRNICLSVGLNRDMAEWLRDELNAVLDEQNDE